MNEDQKNLNGVGQTSEPNRETYSGMVDNTEKNKRRAISISIGLSVVVFTMIVLVFVTQSETISDKITDISSNYESVPTYESRGYERMDSREYIYDRHGNRLYLYTNPDKNTGDITSLYSGYLNGELDIEGIQGTYLVGTTKRIIGFVSIDYKDSIPIVFISEEGVYADAEQSFRVTQLYIYSDEKGNTSLDNVQILDVTEYGDDEIMCFNLKRDGLETEGDTKEKCAEMVEGLIRDREDTSVDKFLDERRKRI